MFLVNTYNKSTLVIEHFSVLEDPKICCLLRYESLFKSYNGKMILDLSFYAFSYDIYTV